MTASPTVGVGDQAINAQTPDAMVGGILSYAIISMAMDGHDNLFQFFPKTASFILLTQNALPLSTDRDALPLR